MFAPLVQAVISAAGWAAAMWTLAAVGAGDAAAGVAAAPSQRRRRAARALHAGLRAGIGLREQLRIALRDRSYWLLHLGFFTCGLHIAFLVTHLPGEIALCGLPASVSAISLALIGLFNVAGSLAAGWLGQRYRMKYLLAAMYASRAVMIAIYLCRRRRR